MHNAIALIDGNNFYTSCEQSLDPSLINQPLVVLSNNDGCIVARNAHARKLGIPMGQPYFKLRHELERLKIAIRSSNYTLYGDMSKRLMSLLKEHCDQIEIYSIDEAFVQIRRPTNNDLYPWARSLRELIIQNLGLPIAIGIGSNKSQAKIANHLAKSIASHAGIFDFSQTQEPDKWLETIDISDVWGVGRKLSKWFQRHGIYNAKQLRDMPSEELKSKCGVKGLRLQLELYGHNCLPLVVNRSPKKETCVSRSFSRPISEINELCQSVACYVVRASEKLRAQKQLAGSITVFIRTSLFISPIYNKSATHKLEIPTNDTGILLAESLKLTRQIFRPNYSLVKAGVVMRLLQSTDHLQQNLLSNQTIESQANSEKLMKTVDKINRHYGNNTITWAACGVTQDWMMKRNKLSRCATTRITEIPITNA